MTDERRDRYAAALGHILEAFIKRPYVTGARLDLADAAMAVADTEQHGVRATVEKQRDMIGELRQQNRRLRIDLGVAREDNDRLHASLSYAKERREHHWSEVKRLRATIERVRAVLDDMERGLGQEHSAALIRAALEGESE